MSSKASKQQANNILVRNADILEHIARFVTLQDGSFRLVSKDFNSFSNFQPYIGRISPELTDVNTLLGQRTTIIIQSKYEDLNYVVKALDIVKAVRDLKDKSVLTNLDLSSNRVGVEGAKALAEALKVNRVLVNLNLASNYLGGDLIDDGDDMSGILALAAALGSSVLTDLNLADNNLASCKYVQESALPHNNYNSGDVVNYKGQEFTVLEEKDDDGDVLLASNVGVKAIAKALENSVLTNLNLRNNYIRPDGAKALADALSTVNMTKLDVGHNNIDEEAALAIVRAVLRPGNIMTSLGLARCSIGPEGAKEIADYVKDTKDRSVLKTLDLGLNPIGSEGAKALAAALEVNGVLTNLNLESNDLTDGGNDMSGILALADALKSGSGVLKTLDLKLNSIGSEGAKALAAALEVNGVLTNLNLASNNLTNGGKDMSGILALADALKSGSSVFLNLIGNQLCGLWYDEYGMLKGTYDASGVKALAEAIKVNGVLKGCDMRFNFLDAAAEQMLRDAVKGRESFDLLV